jgi:hypothetical protein
LIPREIYGVDFSGAKKAGENIWVARAVPSRRGLVLKDLWNLERRCGTADRGPALQFLVNQITDSAGALWGMDFPFALPIEVVPRGTTWADQLGWVGGWKGDAYDLGVECVNRSRRSHGKLHIRRTTDAETQAPFDCYHYRIIYQTFFGMRDVLAPLAKSRGTAVMPFHHRRLASARRVVVESCPGSTLRRLRLPYQNYKQPLGGPLVAKRLRTRHAIFQGIGQLIDIPASHRRTAMRNPGGDALDAIIACVGAYHGWTSADHARIRRHPRYPLEGYMYC